MYLRGPDCAACRRLIAYAANGRKRISQSEFTEKAWQAIVAGPELAQQSR